MEYITSIYFSFVNEDEMTSEFVFLSFRPTKNSSPLITLQMNISPKYDAKENIGMNIFLNNNII